jgi:16S rRNA (uracil1498-N3)-methyltransferase
LTIATAVPKGDRFGWLIEKATELGVARIVPIMTERSVVDPRDSKLDKMRQASITACKQCGRNHLMHIAAITSWKDFLQNIAQGSQFLIAHPYESTGVDALQASGGPKLTDSSNLESALNPSTSDQISKKITIVIGPEGGFSDSEVQSALALGAIPIQLGNYILRIETAAIAAAAKYLL